MLMYVFAYTVSMLAVVIRCEGIEKCRTPNGSLGRCIPLEKCPRIYKITKNSPIYPSDIKEIEARTGACDSNLKSTHLLVCCEIAQDSPPPSGAPSTTTSRPPSPKPTKIPIVRPPMPRHMPPTTSTEPPVIPPKSLLECGKRPPDYKAVGGVEDIDNVHTWTVFLDMSRSKTETGRCAGSMVTNRHVLTAAHCVHHLELDDITMYFGLIKRSELDTCLKDGNCQQQKAEDFIVHEDYHEHKKLNDVALILTKNPVVITDFIAPICLPLNHVYDDSSNNSVFAVGWGMTIGEKLSDAKQVALLRVIPKDECEKPFRSNATVPPSIMCTLGVQMGQDVCQGDSGAPLEQLHNRLVYVVGVVSHGPRCGMNPGVPGKAMRVSYYMDWILNKIGRSRL